MVRELLRNTWPPFVRLAVWPSDTRKSSILRSLVMAAVGASLCLTSRWMDFVVGIISLVLSLWFWLAGKWVDHNSKWE